MKRSSLLLGLERMRYFNTVLPDETRGPLTHVSGRPRGAPLRPSALLWPLGARLLTLLCGHDRPALPCPACTNGSEP
jgi:hypothetical protein